MRKLLYIILFASSVMFSQSKVVESDNERLSSIKHKLELLSVDSPGLNDQAKTEINVSNITLSNFILGISNAHDVNINISNELDHITISNNNFSDVIVADLLVFLCKEYNLTIDFTGNILSIKTFKPIETAPQKYPITVNYDPNNSTISIDTQDNTLYEVFKTIMDKSSKNLVFTPGLENNPLTIYTKEMPFDTAMHTIALSNNLYVEKTNEGFYLFEKDEVKNDENQSISRLRNAQNQNYKILDFENKILEVDFQNTSIASIINNLSADLELDIFTATPLEKAGSLTFKTKSIAFDELLVKMFESRVVNQISQNSNPNPQNTNNNRPQPQNNSSSDALETFTFKKEGNTYFFGTEDQLSVRKIEVIHLMHRSVELLSDPEGGNSRSRTVGRNLGNNYGDYNRSFNSGINQNTFNTSSNNRFGTNRQQNSSRLNGNSNNSSIGTSQTIDDIIPPELSEGLDIQADNELNCLYVTGSSGKIERLKEFITYIDKTVPVVLIEVMFVEVSRNNTVETGVTWGIGDESVETRGGIFPSTDLTLGAKTINKVINGFSGFDQLNLGKVIPNFFATVKAMESNGNLKIRSTPKLSTLNGHRATFSNGETSYYTVTQRNIYGTDNPQTSEITNYEPIDAELGLTIKPLVSGDGQVTLDIFVIQSSFGDRIDENAPPDISSREFSSIIRVQDQDIVVLGGLEEQRRSNSGTGVPFLARVPVIKWLFSSRKREASKAKLTVFIKPTIIY
ncbi:general secretion pathway protein GspD [Hyunsoonleella flava]|uniref:General secretion pathway protein GspD n=1 Tax=Hyunsoonleella flava TaxID=2527939 RepID=A0A4Q9FF24_9FLAO|nr:general secretion pathway protein GspD [Hyunsoonleella flava]TBN04467.1 general secretion pathway protein GspD [Hyunsoonleella flava]